MLSIIQATEATELSVNITTSAYGYCLKLISFVPIARHPEDQVKFQGTFSTAELKSFRHALDRALASDADSLAVKVSLASTESRPV